MNTTSIKIGTIGTGRMAENLGRLWAAKGHLLFFGSRDLQKARTLAERVGRNARGGTHAEAVAFGDVLLLCTPWTAAEETLKALGPLDGKILIDITNPVKPTDAGMQLAHDCATSFAEQIAAWVPGAKVVKAFNMTHYQNLDRPQFGAAKASSFFCGDDAQAKSWVGVGVSDKTCYHLTLPLGSEQIGGVYP